MLHIYCCEYHFFQVFWDFRIHSNLVDHFKRDVNPVDVCPQHMEQNHETLWDLNWITINN